MTASPIAVVLGSFRGGTSCVAGTLHQLGVVMGKKMRAGNRNNQKGFFEAPSLAKICRQAFSEPGMRQLLGKEAIVSELRKWHEQRTDWAIPGERIGAKHPTLCMMIPEMLEAWGNCRFMRVVRPVEDSTASLKRAGWYSPHHQHRLPRLLVANRDNALLTVDRDAVIDLRLRELIDSPETQVDRLCKFLEISPSDEQRDAAIQFPEKRLAVTQ